MTKEEAVIAYTDALKSEPGPDKALRVKGALRQVLAVVGNTLSPNLRALASKELNK